MLEEAWQVGCIGMCLEMHQMRIADGIVPSIQPSSCPPPCIPYYCC